jgi:hypothetical protein
MDDIVIPSRSLDQTLNLIAGLGLSLGENCTILIPSHDLQVNLSLVSPSIKARIEKGHLNQRIDHTIVMTIEQLNYLKWLGDRLTEEIEGDEIKAIIKYGISKVNLRNAIIQDLVGDILRQRGQDGSVLIYGNLQGWAGAEILPYPDGRSRNVHSLIHFSHPASPEELWLREHRVRSTFIYRFHIPGLDDAEWAAQNEARQPFSDVVWRRVLGERVAIGGNGILS